MRMVKAQPVAGFDRALSVSFQRVSTGKPAQEIQAKVPPPG
ncbi:hypothetical protein [Kalamiella sp. sgz302252]